MNSQFDFTVNNILSRDVFKRAEVYSGKKGLTNVVKWTHIIESEKYVYTLNGGELILTTGIGIDVNKNYSFIKQLIDKNVAAICIETEYNFQSISSEIYELSESNNIPIIIFNKSVRFVEITHDIHRFIINSQYIILNRLYELSKKINSLSMLPNGTLKILQEISSNLSTSVFYIRKDNKDFYYPPKARKNMSNLKKYIQTNNIDKPFIKINDTYFIIKKNKQIGYLCMVIDKNNKNLSFYNMVLDQASLAFSQILLRNEISEEKKQDTESEVVQKLLQNKLNNINDLDTLLPFSFNSSQYRVIVILTDLQKSNFGDNLKQSKLRISSLLRNILIEYNLFPIISIKEDEIRIISFSFGGKESLSTKEKYNKIHNKILNNAKFNQFFKNKVHLGIGKSYDTHEYVSQSYIEAKRVIDLNYYNVLSIELYDNIGIYELLFKLEDEEKIISYINTHLENILNLEYKTQETLLTTLEVYLDYNGSYKLASEALLIVRQTLYHRINKLKDILGDDFLTYPKRLGIETSIKAYRYMLKSNKL